MAEVRAVDGDAMIGVASSSRDTRRRVGPLAWVALEELALRAVAENGALAVETSVRDLAGGLDAGKDAVAAALTRPMELGLVRCQTRRAAGRYAGSAYVLEVDACGRAGLVLRTASRLASPCPVPPCPVKPVTAQRDAVRPDAIAAARPEGEPAPSPPPAHDRGPLPQSLFDPSDASPSSSALPTSPPPSSPASSPDPDPSPLFPPNPEADTSAPGVRQPGGQL